MDDRSHLWETWRTCQGYYNKKTSLHGWYCWSFILRHGEQYQPTPHCNFGKMTRQIPSLKLIKSDCRAAKIEIGMEIKMSYWGRKRSICWLPSQQYCTIVEELFGLRQGVLPSKQSCTLTFGDNAFHADQVTKVPAGQCARGHMLVAKTETQVFFHQPHIHGHVTYCTSLFSCNCTLE